MDQQLTVRPSDEPAGSTDARKIEWYSVFQFALSMLGVFGLWSLALVLVLLGVTQTISDGASMTDAIPPLLMAAGLGVSGLLLLPSAGFSLWRLVGKRFTAPARWIPWLRPTLLILALPLVLFLGHLSTQNEALGWLFLPALHVLAVGLPVLWLLYLAQRGLPLGSLQRAWGVFGSGLVLGPLLIMVFEIVALLGFILLGALFLSSQPELADQISAIAQQLVLSQGDPQEVLTQLQPLFTNPWVIFSVIVFGAVLVPLIEEAIKPMGVWLLAGRTLTPADGFTAGLLSGAGYALFESLALSSGGEDWLLLVVARIGTGVVHILNTGLMGWALALAWQEKRYLRLGITYLTVVAIHGLWNGLTLLSSFVTLMQAEGTQTVPDLVVQIGWTAPIILGLLTVGGFMILLASNRSLRRASPPPPPEQAFFQP